MDQVCRLCLRLFCGWPRTLVYSICTFLLLSFVPQRGRTRDGTSVHFDIANAINNLQAQGQLAQVFFLLEHTLYLERVWHEWLPKMMTESSGRVSRHKSKAHRTHTDLKDYDIGFPQSVEEIESVQSRMVHLVESLERGEQSMVNNHRYVINDTIRKMVSFPDPFDKKQFLLTRKDLVSNQAVFF